MLGRSHRFHGHNSLRYAYQNGQLIRGSQLSIKYVLNDRRSNYRCAVVVSRKVHKSAVDRNRIRRRIYEIIRHGEPLITKPYDIVVTVFSDQLILLPMQDLEHLVLSQLKKAHIMSAGPLPRPQQPTHAKMDEKE